MAGWGGQVPDPMPEGEQVRKAQPTPCSHPTERAGGEGAGREGKGKGPCAVRTERKDKERLQVRDTLATGKTVLSPPG